jgi:hypothetical protein
MDNKLIDDIINMLDSSMSAGTGHMNITVDENNEVAYDSTDIEKTVESLGCTDCAKGDLACNIPTLHEGIDE